MLASIKGCLDALKPGLKEYTKNCIEKRERMLASIKGCLDALKPGLKEYTKNCIEKEKEGWPALRVA